MKKLLDLLFSKKDWKQNDNFNQKTFWAWMYVTFWNFPLGNDNLIEVDTRFSLKQFSLPFYDAIAAAAADLDGDDDDGAGVAMPAS